MRLQSRRRTTFSSAVPSRFSPFTLPVLPDFRALIHAEAARCRVRCTGSELLLDSAAHDDRPKIDPVSHILEVAATTSCSAHTVTLRRSCLHRSGDRHQICSCALQGSFMKGSVPAAVGCDNRRTWRSFHRIQYRSRRSDLSRFRASCGSRFTRRLLQDADAMPFAQSSITRAIQPASKDVPVLQGNADSWTKPDRSGD